MLSRKSQSERSFSKPAFAKSMKFPKRKIRLLLTCHPYCFARHRHIHLACRRESCASPKARAFATFTTTNGWSRLPAMGSQSPNS